MKRKDFIKTVPALVAAGITLDLSSCNSRDTANKTTGTNVKDTLSADTTDSFPMDVDDSIRIIDADTIKTAYSPPVLINYARTRYCDIVAQNAERVFPKSKPYLELILKANTDFRTIFDIPPEYHIGLLQQESEFDPNAVSTAPAVGIAQFMYYTAKGMGLKVYDQKKFSELYEKERQLKLLNDQMSKSWKGFLTSMKSNNFDIGKAYKLEYDGTVPERDKLKQEVKYIYIHSITKEDDERKDPFKSTPMSFRHLAELARWADKYYNGKNLNSTEIGINAYNCGIGNVKKGIGYPFIEETNNYKRNIIANANKIAPKQPSGYMYDANSQIIAELIASKIYAVDGPLKK